MKTTTLLTYGLALITGFSSCSDTAKTDDAGAIEQSQPAATDMRQVRTEIQQVENEWAEAINKKDINALMSLYADDAISMQDRGPSLNGKAEIQAQQEKDFASPSRYASIAFQTQDVYGTADEVTEVGTSEEKDAAGKVVGTGKYVAIFKSEMVNTNV